MHQSSKSSSILCTTPWCSFSLSSFVTGVFVLNVLSGTVGSLAVEVVISTDSIVEILTNLYSFPMKNPKVPIIIIDSTDFIILY